MQLHVDRDVREQVRDAATAAGVSMSAYIEALLLRQETDEQGRPLWWRELKTKEQEEELDLTG